MLYSLYIMLEPGSGTRLVCAGLAYAFRPSEVMWPSAGWYKIVYVLGGFPSNSRERESVWGVVPLKL